MKRGSDLSGRAQPAPLIKSYTRWRSSRLGQITDVLEQELLFELMGALVDLTLLDVGCGDAELVSKVARRGAHVVGLDADIAMLTASRWRAHADNGRCVLVGGRAEMLPFKEASFDRVVAVATLCFIDDTERAVSEMARVLKPGGQLVIGELGRWSLWAAYRRIRGWMGHPTWRAAKFRTAGALRKLAEAAGLDVVEVRGAVHYPPCAIAARLLAPVDLRLKSTAGAAFIALRATKPRQASVADGSPATQVGGPIAEIRGPGLVRSR